MIREEGGGGVSFKDLNSKEEGVLRIINIVYIIFCCKGEVDCIELEV